MKEALHYIILVFVGVFVAHEVSGITGIESWAINNGIMGMLGLFVYYLAWIVVTDLALQKYLLKEKRKW